MKTDLTKYLLFGVICFSSIATTYAHDGSGSIGAISFATEEAFGQLNQKCSLLFLPSYEQQPPAKLIFPLGFVYVPAERVTVVGRTKLYEIHYNVGDQTTRGQGDSDLLIYYVFKNKIKNKYQQAFLINFHLPTGNINRQLTDGFLRYEPSYILSYATPISKNLKFLVFNQTGLSIRQRLKVPSAESHSEIDNDLDSTVDDGPALSAHSVIWIAGIAAVTKKAQLSVELDWENNRWNNHGLVNALYVTPRIFYALTNQIQIGVSAPIGLNYNADEYRIWGFIRIGLF